MSINSVLLSQKLSGLEIKSTGQAFTVTDIIPTSPFNMFIIEAALRKVIIRGILCVDILITSIPNVPRPNGVLIWVYDNDDGLESQIVIEQDGTGDATLCFKLSEGIIYAMGIDNSHPNDAFKLSRNSTLGANDLILIDSSDLNIGLGINSLGLVSGGTSNIALGHNSGNLLTTGSNNICIGNTGIAANSSIIRLGTFGTHTSTFIAGIANATPVGLTQTVIIDITTGELGSIPIGGGGADVIGTPPSTDNAIARYDGITGIVIQNSNITIDDSGHFDKLGINFLHERGGTFNFAAGSNALGAITSGNSNTAIGYNSLRLFTTGTHSTAIGTHTLENSTGGSDNVAVGYSALERLISDSFSTAVGAHAIEDSTSGTNTALGYSALRNIITGDENVALGYEAGRSLTLADSNNILIKNNGTAGDSNRIRIGTFGTHTSAFMAGIAGVTPVGSTQAVIIDTATGELGSVAGGVGGNVVGTPPSTDNAIARYDGITGLLIQNSIITVDDSGFFYKSALDFLHERGTQGNFGVGTNALTSITSGNRNTAIGQNALQFITNSSDCTAVGNGALVLTTGTQNTAVGSFALNKHTTNNQNTAVGYVALGKLVTGSDNIALGEKSGFNFTTSESDNIMIGNEGDVGDNNTIRIGLLSNHNAEIILGGLIDNKITVLGGVDIGGGGEGSGTGLTDFTIHSIDGKTILSAGRNIADAVQITSTHASGGVQINAGSGGIAFDGKIITSRLTTSNGPNAVPITGAYHEITTTATGNALTLIDGTIGQHLILAYIAQVVGADTAILTPTSLAGTDTTITFNNLGDSAYLLFTSTGWIFLGGNAIVA